MTNEDTLKVSEIFYSIQGEGKTAGVPAVFIRLTSCNLLCGGKGTVEDGKLHDNATWRCDTIEVWLKGKVTPFEHILTPSQVSKLRGGAHLIFTGGEPLLQKRSIISFITWFSTTFRFLPFIEIETNGTIDPGTLFLYVNLWNVSPKLRNSGMAWDKRVRPNVLDTFKSLRHPDTITDIIYKFVITDSTDWQDIINDYDDYIIWEKVWLMPGASDRETLIKLSGLVADICKHNNLHFSNRLQVEIWDKVTGV